MSGGNVTVGPHTAVVTGTPVAPDTTPPTLTSATVQPAGDEISLVFSEDLDIPRTTEAENVAFLAILKSAFSVTADGTSVSIDVVSASTSPFNLMALRVSPAIKQSQAVGISYTDPTTGDDAVAIQDAPGNETASFTTGSGGVSAVTNNSTQADTSGPWLSSTTVQPAGDEISLVFSEDLDIPRTTEAENVAFLATLKSAFSVTADGTSVSIDVVSASTSPFNLMALRVSPAIKQSQAVGISYTDPTTGDDAVAIQDSLGNETASFTTGSGGVPAVTNNSTQAAVVPGAPTSLSATGDGTTRINLSWNAPADNGGRAISGYKIEWSAAGSDPWTVLEATTDSATTTYSNTGLTAGTTRHYRVFAINTIGTGAASNTDSATTSTRVSTRPTSSNRTVTTNEDTDITFTTANFPFFDTDTDDTLMNVKITELPATGKGTLTLDTTAITSSALPKTVTKADLDADKLKYSPPANANGSRYASFKFKVNDGSVDSTAAYTMTINVNRVNDEATGTPSITGSSEVGNTLTASTSSITDPDGLPGSFTYQWKRFAANGTTFEANIGTNSSMYTLTSSEEGKKVKVEVSFTDDGGTREALVSDAFPSSGTVTVPTSDSLNVGGLGVYWHAEHDNGGNWLQVDSCTGVKVFRVIWDGPDGNRRADQWAADITARGGSSAVSQNFRETPGNPGYFELDGRMLLAGPDSISIRVRGRFGSTWGTWSPTARLYCFEN